MKSKKIKKDNNKDTSINQSEPKPQIKQQYTFKMPDFEKINKKNNIRH